MPNRPPKKKKASKRYVPGCKKLMGEEAEAFMKDQMILSTMEAKRERHLEEVGDDEETVTVSIGLPVRYEKTSYLAHIFCIDNFDNPDENGWVVHLWHPGLVMGRHPAYRQYMTQMGNDLGVDLWEVGV